MRDYFNLTATSVLIAGQAGVTPNGDVWVKPEFEEWCKKNLQHEWSIRWYQLFDEYMHPSGSRRLGLHIPNESDKMLFIARWQGDIGKDGIPFNMGPFTLNEIQDIDEKMPRLMGRAVLDRNPS